MTDAHDRPIPQPTHEALWPTDLFTQGIGWVIIARFQSGGRRVEAGMAMLGEAEEISRTLEQ
jgi:hypothetical protein